jgi:hypothetical protein
LSPVSKFIAVALTGIAGCDSDRANVAGGGDGPKSAQVQYDVTEHGVVERARDRGDFEVAAPSDGADWVELRRGRERLFVPRGARFPDLVGYRFGRSDAEFPRLKTDVRFDLSGLGAWRDGDSLQVVSPNVGMTFRGVENAFSAIPTAGVIAIAGETIDWRGALAPLVDARKGDTAWVTQMTNRPLRARSSYSAVTRAGVARDFTVADGNVATLAASLAPVAPERLALRWKISDLAAMVPQVSPHARPATAPALAIRALPDTLARNKHYWRTLYTGLPTLVELGPISGTEDLDEEIEYGNPFSSNGARWTELVAMVYSMHVAIPTPHGVAGLNATFVTATPIDPNGGAIRPAISPVRNVTREGRSFAWDPPLLGAAASYAVTVHGIDESPSGVHVTKLATFFTSAASFDVPSSVIAGASSYVLVITAIAGRGIDLASRPFVGSLPYASADHVTARIFNSVVAK